MNCPEFMKDFSYLSVEDKWRYIKTLWAMPNNSSTIIEANGKKYKLTPLKNVKV